MIKSHKFRLMALTALLMVIVILLVITASNLVFSRYLESEAKKVLQRDIASLGMQEDNAPYIQDDPADQAEYLVLNASPVNSMMFFTTLDYQPVDKIYAAFSPLEKAIAKYSSEHADLSGRIQQVKLNNQVLYIAQIRDWSHGGQDDSLLILYASISPLQRFLSMLNQVFLVVLTLFGLLATFLGMRLGRTIDTTQRRTRQFFANASHELKTPLMVIQGFAEGIQTGVVSKPQEAASIILEENDRMASLVDELIFLSKVEGGHLHLRKVSFQLFDLLEDCVLELANLARQQKIAIHLAKEQDWPQLLGDPHQLRRVMINILSNALRHSHSRIDIYPRKDRRKISICIQDDGAGIKPADLPHIFDRFYSGRKGTSGIGLSIAREIVLLHGGSLSASNLEGGGACFVITLPGESDRS